ncbi:pyrroline-5-carboxylate reductase, partial [Candidatus Sumerlaeota bacterium]|nr:pyrroline-5-carboxylate reductase [Candidatus Sumerlaeota bacterium]
SMITAGVKSGIPEEIAEELVKQTAIGSARLAAESLESLAELRKKVTSPGGTTEAAMQVFLKYKFKDVVIAAIQRATQRAEELSQKS